MKILLAGCGGTGIEILKLLSLYREEYVITVIDNDKIEIVNLNRLFCFTERDVGLYKSEKAASIFKCKYIVDDILELTEKDIEEFDCVISAVDNIETRMHLNFIFKKSKCNIFLDCGVYGDVCHALMTNRDGFCLYCIKELYQKENNLGLCSLKYLKKTINKENRFELLKSHVNYYKSEGLKPEEIINKFNEQVNSELQTNLKEVEHLYENIVPSVCYTNSICASLVVNFLRSKTFGVFINFDGSGLNTNKIQIARDDTCFLCRKYDT
ncbi:NEDD8-activating enzyme E1 catalytic subunit [Nosema bombycis CQ1]|uniref:NEDD8-activating enzyme E1 catalytic subunit n=1 Tax=Nosema bombycis (strain CQ1 / CVCC 102059) TaxID=578461 RepID=R0MIZ4_NOSB1|nr:NEDD8-activating enzyme E1 catalytic subunit [Nosema bombycis CQ1]|eukprot:EOB14185.1 NEDD8-activating enzyme E1 catalytic subunit [Nosema bombycis CQ1]